MRERYQLFRATRESVLSQDGDFQWVLSFDERTPESHMSKILSDERMIGTTLTVWDYFKEYEPDTEWIITQRMDNDDILLPGAVTAIQKEFKPALMVIDIEYYQYDLISGNRYTSGNVNKGERHRLGCTSPFLSLVEPTDYIKTCYSRPHNKLMGGYPFEDGTLGPIGGMKIRTPFALMVVHSENLGNKITGFKV
jgi:hypothetical protein